MVLAISCMGAFLGACIGLVYLHLRSQAAAARRFEQRVVSYLNDHSDRLRKLESRCAEMSESLDTLATGSLANNIRQAIPAARGKVTLRDVSAG
jgi:hypothetical protein